MVNELEYLQNEGENKWNHQISYYRKSKTEGDALALWVNGHHHTGWVVIVLAWNDTYTYYLVNKDFSIKKKVQEVYFDELQYKIDKDIEYINLYGNR